MLAPRFLKWYAAIIVVVAIVSVRVAVLALAGESLQEDSDSYARLAVNWSESGVFGFRDATGAVQPTAYRPPGYPWLLSTLVHDGSVSHWGLGGLHLILGLVTVWLAYRIAQLLRIRSAWIVASAVAFDPLLLRSSQLAMTETLAAFLVACIWWFWLRCVAADPVVGPVHRWRDVALPALGLGILFGLAVLVRPTVAPWALLCGGWLVRISVPKKTAWRTGGLFASGLLACILPWTLRNQLELGKPIWATSHGGYTLLLANNPSLYEHFRQNGPSRGWNAEPFHRGWDQRGPQAIVDVASDSSTVSDSSRRANTDALTLLDAQSTPTDAHSTQLDNVSTESPTVLTPVDHNYWFIDRPPTSFPTPIDELVDDRLAYHSAFATMRREPMMFALSCVYRTGWFWGAWPYFDQFSGSALLIGVWYLAWFTAVLVGGCAGGMRRQRTQASQRQRWRDVWFPAVSLLLALTAVHAVYWGNMRMRAPLMVAVYAIAVASTEAARRTEP